MATLTPRDKNTVASNEAWAYNKPGVTYNEAGYSYNFFGDLIAGISTSLKRVVSMATRNKN